MKNITWLFLLICSFAYSDGVIQQNTSTQPIWFLMTDSTDHITGKTGLTVSVKICKPGPTCVTPSGTVTQIDATNAPGWYQLSGNATDSNTLGPLLLNATAAGADPTSAVYQVVAYNPLDGVRLGLTALPNVASGAAGAIITAGTGTAQLSTSSGLVTVGTNNDKTGYTASTVSDKTGYSLSGSQTFNTSGTVGGVSGVTFPASVASPTNITAGTITTVTNLTNAPTVGDLTNTMKASVTTAATAATPTISSVSGAVGSVTGSVGSLGVQAKIDVTTAATAATPTAAGVTATVNADIKKVNGVTVNGNGSTIPWGP